MLNPIDTIHENLPVGGPGLTFLKLREDCSNYPTWEFQAKNVLAALGCLPHIDGRATSSKPDPVTEETPSHQVQTLTAKNIAYEVKEGYAKHLIFDSCPHLLQLRLISCESARDMWLEVNNRAIGSKRILDEIDVLCSSYRVKLQDHPDPKIYLTNVRKHFELMEERRLWLAATGRVLTEVEYFAMITASISDTNIYRKVLEPLIHATKKLMPPQKIIDFVVRQAESTVLDDSGSDQTTTPGIVICENPSCRKKGHKTEDCYAPGGAKEGQGPRRRRKNQRTNDNKSADTIADDDNDDEEIYAFAALTLASDPSVPIDSTEIITGTYSCQDNMLPKQGILLDSGASTHFCPNRSLFTSFRKIQQKILLADGRTVLSEGSSEIRIDMPNGDSNSSVLLKDVVYAPSLSQTLLSVWHFDKTGHSIMFSRGQARIYDEDRNRIAVMPAVHNLYPLYFSA